MTISPAFKKPWFITSAVFLALIVAISAGILIFVPDESKSASSQNTPTMGSSLSVSPPASSDDDSVCGLPAGDQTVPVTPPEATWVLVGSMAMPTRDDIGPAVTSDEGIHSCYAHNPTGAMFSAAGIAAAGLSGKQEIFLESRAVPSAARDRVISQERAKVETDGLGEGYGGDTKLQISAFQVLSVTDQVITLSFIMMRTTGSEHDLVSMAITMQWHEGDWKAVVQDTGSVWMNASVERIIPPQFTPWSGV